MDDSNNGSNGSGGLHVHKPSDQRLREVEILSLKELATYWEARALKAEDQLSALTAAPFKQGSRVTYVDRPAWGEGRVEEVNVPSETCIVRWVRAMSEFESIVEVPWVDLEPVDHEGAQDALRYD